MEDFFSNLFGSGGSLDVDTFDVEVQQILAALTGFFGSTDGQPWDLSKAFPKEVPKWAPWHPEYEYTHISDRDGNIEPVVKRKALPPSAPPQVTSPPDWSLKEDMPDGVSVGPPVSGSPTSEDGDSAKGIFSGGNSLQEAETDLTKTGLGNVSFNGDGIGAEVRRTVGPQVVAFTQYSREGAGAFKLDARFNSQNVNPELRGKFNALQSVLGEELKVNSVYRDPQHNASVGGAKGSQHIHGNAVDINVAGWPVEKRLALIEKASALGFNGVGVYDNAIHLDVGSKRAWGPNFGSSSIPEWASKTVKAHLLSKFVPMNTPPPQAGRFVEPSQYFSGIDVESLPAGMRNNNPGNLKYSGSEYQRTRFSGIIGPSKNTDEGTPQIKFASPEDGMSATATLVLDKFDGGLDSIKKIITDKTNGWTPGRGDAAANIASMMGMSVDDKVNLRDPITLGKFIRALITQEHGPSSRLYSNELIAHGIKRAFSRGR